METAILFAFAVGGLLGYFVGSGVRDADEAVAWGKGYIAGRKEPGKW